MNILFICSGNTCRSPMAQGLMEGMAKEKNIELNIKSAGIFALDGQQIASNAIEALKTEGIDISHFRSSIIDKDLVEEADLILTMSRSHKTALLSKYSSIEEKLYTLKEYAYSKEEDIGDPYGGSLDVYNSTKEEIKDALKKVIDKLK